MEKEPSPVTVADFLLEFNSYGEIKDACKDIGRNPKLAQRVITMLPANIGDESGVWALYEISDDVLILGLMNAGKEVERREYEFLKDGVEAFRKAGA